MFRFITDGLNSKCVMEISGRVVTRARVFFYIKVFTRCVASLDNLQNKTVIWRGRFGSRIYFHHLLVFDCVGTSLSFI